MMRTISTYAGFLIAAGAYVACSTPDLPPFPDRDAGSSTGGISSTSTGGRSGAGGEGLGPPDAGGDPSCTLNSDCPSPLVCSLRRCREPCQKSIDCGLGASCIIEGLNAVCQPASEKNTPCDPQDPCKPPLGCASDRRCRNSCASDRDCNSLGITGRVCATDSNSVKFCAEPEETKDGVITTPVAGSGGAGGRGSGGAPPSGGGGTTVGAGGGSGGGPDTTPSVTGPATMSSDGVLTNFAGASFVKTSGNIVITTLYLKEEVLSSLHSIQLWGDIENRGPSIECIPLVTLAVNGYDVLTVAYGPAYKDTSPLSSACLPPRGTGAISGIDNNAPPSLLNQGPNITYSFATLVRPSAIPHPGAPILLTAAVTNSTGSYAVSGNMKAGSVDIWNLSLDFFMRDSSGLLRDQHSAFPNELGTIFATSVVPYESYGTANIFGRYVEFPDFIEGVSANFVVGPPSEYSARVQLVKQRFADVAAARRRIRR